MGAKLISKCAFAVVCLSKERFVCGNQKGEKARKPPHATTFLYLWGFRGGLEEGVGVLEWQKLQFFDHDLDFDGI